MRYFHGFEDISSFGVEIEMRLPAMSILNFGFGMIRIFFVCFRSCLAELQLRPLCTFVKWVNTYNDEFLCSHCLRLASTELCIGYYHQSGYFRFLHATQTTLVLCLENIAMTVLFKV